VTGTTPQLGLGVAPAAAGRRIERSLRAGIEAGLESDGCVLLVGPYEVGKSELAANIARGYGEGAQMLDASLQEDRAAMGGLDGVLRNAAGRLVVVEGIHGFPEGLDLIRTALDRARARREHPGRFLLLGSDVSQTQRLVAERLGTRALTFRLAPIALPELLDIDVALESAFAFGKIEESEPVRLVEEAGEMDRLWLRGGYPRSLLALDDEQGFAYCERYIEKLCSRGYAQINPAWSPASIREILDRVAATQGEPFKVDRSKIDQKALLDHLESLGLIRQLRPWFANHLKRLEKNPKIYIRDTGLLHALLHRRTLDELRADGAILGHSWEGFCIENLVEAAPGARPFFYRADTEQEEIDLVLEFSADRRLAIELKSKAAKLGGGFAEAVREVGAVEAFVVRPVPESSQKSGYREMTLRDMIAFVREFGR
jgi:predicted AAA+ superfamily ATPase